MAPRDGRIRYNLALAYYKSADLPRAAEELEALHAKQPADVRATLLLADCRLQLGEPAAVEALLRPLAAARPGRPRRHLHARHGPRAERQGAGRPAARRDACCADGDSAEAQYLVGSAAFMAGDYPAGRRALLERAPEEPEAAVAALVLRPGAALHRRRGRGRAGLSRGPRREPERLRGELLPRLAPRHPRPAEGRAAVRGEGRGPAAAVGRGEGARRVARLARGRRGARPSPVSPLVGHQAPDVTLHGADGRDVPAVRRSAGARSS